MGPPWKGKGLRKCSESGDVGGEVESPETRRRDTVGKGSLPLSDQGLRPTVSGPCSGGLGRKEGEAGHQALRLENTARVPVGDSGL